MKIYINDSNQVIGDPKFNYPVDALTFKRGDKEPLWIYFVLDGTVVAPLSSRQIQFGLKESGAYDSTQFIVYADSPTIVGDHYVLDPNFNTQALNDLLHVDGLSTNDLASVTVMGEITWSDGLSAWESTNTLNVTIVNDVIRNNESTPAALPTPEEWLRTNTAPLEYTGNATLSSAIITGVFDYGGETVPVPLVLYNDGLNEGGKASFVDNEIAPLWRSYWDSIGGQWILEYNALHGWHNFSDTPYPWEANPFVPLTEFANGTPVISANQVLPDYIGQIMITHVLAGDTVYIATSPSTFTQISN